MADELADQVTRVGALAEPARRALYLHVVGQAEAVSRDAAAAAVGVPVHSAKFHLDRLVEGGLLDTEYRRLSGRTGPGAGRPSKLYRRSAREVSVSLPPRSYDLAGRLLAGAIERASQDGLPIEEAVQTVAREAGHHLSGDQPASDAPPGDDASRIAQALTPLGYEPRVEDAGICLVNCPFDALAAEHTELVCGMNLSLIRGMLEAMDITALAARLAPAPDRCCVRLETAAPRTTR